MFGSHLSISGNLSNALREAEKLRMDTVQVFTKNQQQWRVKPLEEAVVREWSSEIARLGWQGRTTAHASYLINLASPSDELWRKSVDLMRVEIERCEALGIPFLVHHPGSPTGAGVEFGLERIAAAYRELFTSTKGFRTVSCLENTVGAGSTIGGPFDQLSRLRAMIIDRTGQDERVGFCIDTCHAHAAGYDLSTRALGDAALRALDATCGLRHVRVLHINDSKGAAGSRLDRHAHIGEGTIGGNGRANNARPDVQNSGFASFVAHLAFRDVPKILETPKGSTGAGVAYDSLNLRRLRKLAPPAEPIHNDRPVPSRPRSISRRRGKSAPKKPVKT